MRTITVAVVGAGYWGPNLIRNFHAIPGTRVTYVCDAAADARERISLAYPFIHVTPSYRDVLENPAVDLVAIATPVTTHYELAVQAIAAGKHVMVEKPMTKTTEEGKQLIEMAKRNRRILFVGHTLVYNPATKYMKRLIDSKKLGQPYYFDSIRINTKLVRPDVNVIWDLAPHDISLLWYFFQEKPVRLQAFGGARATFPRLEIAHLIFHYRDGLTAHIHVNWISPVKLRKLMIGGSRRMVVYDDLEPSEKLKIYRDNVAIPPSEVTSFKPAYRSGDILIPKLDQTEPLYIELAHCIDCVRKGKEPLTDGRMGLSVVRLLEASDRSLSQKTEIALR